MSRESDYQRALNLICAEARKNKPDPDKIFNLANNALSQFHPDVVSCPHCGKIVSK